MSAPTRALLDEIESLAGDSNSYVDDLFFELVDIKSRTCGPTEAMADRALEKVEQLRLAIALIRSMRRELDETLFPIAEETAVTQ